MPLLQIKQILVLEENTLSHMTKNIIGMQNSSVLAMGSTPATTVPQ